jgi:hypothetical protein
VSVLSVERWVSILGGMEIASVGKNVTHRTTPMMPRHDCGQPKKKRAVPALNTVSDQALVRYKIPEALQTAI